MVRVPKIESQVLPNEIPTTRISSELFTSGGQQIQQVAKQLKNINDEFTRIRDFKEESLETIGLSEEISKVKDAQFADNDTNNLETYNKQVDEIVERRTEGITSPLKRVEIANKFKLAGMDAKSDMGLKNNKKLINQSRGAYYTQLAQLSDSWRNKGEGGKLIVEKQIENLIDSAVGIDAKELANTRANYKKALVLGEAQELAYDDPDFFKEKDAAGAYDSLDSEDKVDLRKAADSRKKSLDAIEDEKIQANNDKIKSEFIAQGMTIQDYDAARAQGVFKTPAEAKTYKNLAINGVNVASKTNSMKRMSMYNEFFALGTPDAKRQFINKSSKNLEDISAFRLKIAEMNQNGELSLTDFNTFMRGTQKIFDEKSRKEVEKKAGFWANVRNFFLPGDDFSDEVTDAVTSLQSDYFNRAIIGDEDPENVLTELELQAVWTKNPPLNGVQVGGTWVNPNGVEFIFEGINRKTNEPRLRPK